MSQIPVLLFISASTIILSRLIDRRRITLTLSMLAELLFDAFYALTITLLVSLPLGRATLHLHENFVPRSLELGAAALLFYTMVCIMMGIIQGKLHLHFSFGWITPAAPAASRLSIRCIRAIAQCMMHLLLLVMILLTAAFLWAAENYTLITLDEIVFYLSMPLQGTATSFAEDVFHFVLIPSCIAFLSIQALIYLPLKRRLRFSSDHPGRHFIDLLPLRMPLLTQFTLLILWFMLLFPAADQFLKIRSFFSSYIQTSSFIEEEYVDPHAVTISFPEQKRNLITLYVESAESTSQDVANGGAFDVNYIPEMTQLASEHISFSQSDLLHGASVSRSSSWTIAGLVAETSALPLKLFATNQTRHNNMGDQFESFLPGAVTLGDLLLKQGYHNYFMAGSDFTFGGRRQYFTQHGDYQIFDLLTAYEESFIPEDYFFGWGLEDSVLFSYAKHKLTEISASNQPFHFSLLTVDTHHPGYNCALCPEDDSGRFGRVLRCSSAQISEFIAWCSEQDFYKNTSIVILGDHCSMVSGFYDSDENPHFVASKDTPRLVYNAFINCPQEPVQQKNRLFTTMDFFPSQLAAIGVSIEGNRLGLGTNLFSDRLTLSEEYGHDYVFSEIEKRSPFYDAHLLYP